MTQDANIRNAPLMSARRSFYPFNAEQTVNILSEFGPLVTMFIVNAFYGIADGTWALIITTIIAIAVMFYVFRRPPVFPLIASSVTIIFGALTLITNDPMWVQIKVTIFNALFGVFLISGLWLKQKLLQVRVREDLPLHRGRLEQVHLELRAFLLSDGRRQRGVRRTFQDEQLYYIFGQEMNGVNIWILFKICDHAAHLGSLCLGLVAADAEASDSRPGQRELSQCPTKRNYLEPALASPGSTVNRRSSWRSSSGRSWYSSSATPLRHLLRHRRIHGGDGRCSHRVADRARTYRGDAADNAASSSWCSAG